MHIVLHTALPEPGAGAQPPEWVHLVPAGTFRGVDARGPYTLRDPQAVIAASMAGGKLAIDENHATDFARNTGQSAPARGWITEMQARADGIWGRVTWTTSGLQLMREGAYRGFSPVLAIDKGDGVTVRGVLRGALTNTPNLGTLTTLHTQESPMDLATIRTTLGLPADADEAAILARIGENATAVTRHSADLESIAAAAGATATTATGLVTVLQTQRAAATNAQTMAGQVVELQTQLSTLQSERGRERATAFIDASIAAGKPIAPIREHYIARHMADRQAVETEIGAMPSIHAGGIAGEHVVTLQAMGGGDDWSAEEKMSCERMGISKEKFMANKKKKMDMMKGAA